MIAETTDLPTKFAKMVVTNDQGRYVIPDLPKAKYTLWVRGYGWSIAEAESAPGKLVNLTATPAPTPPRRRNIIRACTGTRCSKSGRRASSPAPATRATASRRS